MNIIKNLFSVKNKVVIVTGGANGNGRAISEGFLTFGAKVIIIDTESIDDDFNEMYKNNVFSYEFDLQNKELLPDIVTDIERNFGQINVLVNNAGGTVPDAKDKKDIWDEIININLSVPYTLSELVAPVMAKKGKGSIINISSLGASLGFPGNPSYQASKGGLKQLTKALAVDYCDYGIRVNSICPGYIKTNMTMKSYSQPLSREERKKRTILGRWGNPEDLIGAAIFLGSDASSYITGIDLVVDGGWLAKGL